MRNIRRKERAITSENEMKEILQTTQYITIAMSKDNKPYLATLSHGYDPEKNVIYFHSASEGKKIDYLKSNSKIWGQATVDNGYIQGECRHRYMSTQFMGRVTFLDDLEEKKQALIVMIKNLDNDPETVINKEITEKAVQRVTIGRIDIDYMSGKKSI